jgi:Ca2+-binding RTX toxin-like protein
VFKTNQSPFVKEKAMFTGRNNSKRTSTSKRRVVRDCTRPVVESLETRQLLSGDNTAFVMNGVLMIKGSVDSSFHDRILVTVFNGNAVVTNNGLPMCNPVPLTSFSSIQADLFAGDDKINIDHGLPRATLIGNAGNDTLEGGDGDDALFGDVWGDEADVWSDAVGNDNLRGHGGSDTLVGGPGADTLDGGDGTGADVADYSQRINTVSVTFDAMQNDAEIGELDLVLSNVENVWSGSGNDLIDAAMTSADTRANYFSGGPGNDTIRGGFGNDTINGGAGNDTLLGGGDQDLIHGGADSDYIIGGSGSDWCYGDEGDDYLDTYDANCLDVIDGGAGYDTAVYDRSWVYGNDRVLNCERLRPQGQASIFSLPTL